eukprot:86745-Pleurochrysis_carterae.AAC.2
MNSILAVPGIPRHICDLDHLSALDCFDFKVVFLQVGSMPHNIVSAISTLLHHNVPFFCGLFISLPSATLTCSISMRIEQRYAMFMVEKHCPMTEWTAYAGWRKESP